MEQYRKVAQPFQDYKDFLTCFGAFKKDMGKV